MTDIELVTAVLECSGLSEREEEAFESMRDWLEGSGKNRKLSALQRDWAEKVARQKGVFVDESKNLYSSGKVPRGVSAPKTRGEEFAANVLSRRPTAPPGRRP